MTKTFQLVGGTAFAVLALGMGPALAQPQFTGLGTLPGGNNSESRPYAINSDGSIVVGNTGSADAYNDPFRWENGTMVSLGHLGSAPYLGGYAYDMTPDGSIVVGHSNAGNFGLDYQGYRWTAAGGMVSLGTFPIYAPTPRVTARGITHDGSLIVGYGSAPASNETTAFRWTEAGGFQLLPAPTGYFFSSLSDVSADGSVALGLLRSSTESDAALWTPGGGWQVLGPVPAGYTRATPGAISDDGTVVTGELWPGSTASGRRPFRWTAAGGFEVAPAFPGQQDAFGMCISGDGQVIGGGAIFSGGVPSDIRGFIWSASDGYRLVSEVLTNDYLLDLSGWSPSHVTAMNADGSAFAGWGRGPDGTGGWVATGLVSGTTPPTVSIDSPLATPHPGEAYPASEHLWGDWVLDPGANDIPVPIAYTATDDTVALTVSLSLDGITIDPRVSGVAAAASSTYTNLPGDRAANVTGAPAGGSGVYQLLPLGEGTAPFFETFPDGSAVLSGFLIDPADVTQTLLLELRYTSTPAPAGGGVQDLYFYNYVSGGGPIDPASWSFYTLDAAESFVIRVTDGAVLGISEATDGTLQVGDGADGRNRTYGASGRYDLSGPYTGTLELLLDLSAPEALLTPETFFQQGIPMLGQHTLEVTVTDIDGNSATDTRSFEIVFTADWGLLFFDPAQLADDSDPNVVGLLFLPTPPNFNFGDPTQADVVASTLSLEALDTGLTAAPFHAEDLGAGEAYLMIWERDDLRAAGQLVGNRFRLTGRFRSSTGPAFIANYDPTAD